MGTKKILRAARAKAQTAKGFSRQDWEILLQAWLLLLLVDLGLRSLPFLRVQKVLALDTPGENFRESTVEIEQCNRLVKIASNNHLYPMTCLRQALVLQWILRRRRIDTVLKFGVKKEGETIEAHAWLEYQGQAIGQSPLLMEQYRAVLATGGEA